MPNFLKPASKLLLDRVLARLLIEAEESGGWWKQMTKEDQKTYIEEHPNSKYAKKVREKDQEKPQKKEAPKEVQPKGGGSSEPIKSLKTTSLKKVSEKDVHKVSALLDKLKEMTDKAKAAGKKPPDFDLCEVSVPGTNLFCGDHKGIPRAKMPQLKGMPLKGTDAAKLPADDKGEVNAEDAFKEALKKKGVKLEHKKVDAASLKSTQSQLVGTKVASMLDALKKDPENKAIRAPIFVSKDGYILDGHHRWAAVVGLELHVKEPVEMDTITVDLTAEELVDFTNEFADEIGIEQKGA